MQDFISLDICYFPFPIFCILPGGLLNSPCPSSISLGVIFSIRSLFITKYLETFPFPVKLSESGELKIGEWALSGLPGELKALKVNVVF